MIAPRLEATRAAGLARLMDFVPRAGADYARNRNEDRGPQDRSNVSGLSPWIRSRAVTEWEVVAAVVERHGAQAAAMFVQEVCWRTYWKGWLALRPAIWSRYRAEAESLRADWISRPAYRQAVEGRTGIDAFDTFARELVETGYLHNHARMWFASIWIFTLGLPWPLGAEWFLHHLLDGDPASNTLGWRWVAGVQTRGKHYLARAENIRAYTAGRFQVDYPLNETALPVTEMEPIPEPCLLAPSAPDRGRRAPCGWIVTSTDVRAPWECRTRPASIAGFVRAQPSCADAVSAFRSALVRDAVDQWKAEGGHAVRIEGSDGAAQFREWVTRQELKHLLMVEPEVGGDMDLQSEIVDWCARLGVTLEYQRRRWDARLFPHATHGFFRFREQIPLIAGEARTLAGFSD